MRIEVCYRRAEGAIIGDATAILRFWLACEALAPRGFETPENLGPERDVLRFDLEAAEPPPWIRSEDAEREIDPEDEARGTDPERRAPKTSGARAEALRALGLGAETRPGGPDADDGPPAYALALGALAIADFARSFAELYPSAAPEPLAPPAFEALAWLPLDARGRLHPSGPPLVSPFAWAHGAMRREGPGAIGDWPRTTEEIARGLTRVFEDGAAIVDGPRMTSAWRWLLDALSLDASVALPPFFALTGRSALDALESVRARGGPMRRALGAIERRAARRVVGPSAAERRAAPPRPLARIFAPPAERLDPLDDRRALAAAAAPSAQPLARAPEIGPATTTSNDAFRRMAVSHALEDARRSGLAAIDAPPGGETAIADVIAALGHGAVEAMTALEHPEEAARAIADGRTPLGGEQDGLLGSELLLVAPPGAPLLERIGAIEGFALALEPEALRARAATLRAAARDRANAEEAWRLARARFFEAKASSRKALSAADAFDPEFVDPDHPWATPEEARALACARIEAAEEAVRTTRAAVERHRADRPGFASLLIGGRELRVWREEMRRFEDSARQARDVLEAERRAAERAREAENAPLPAPDDAAPPGADPAFWRGPAEGLRGVDPWPGGAPAQIAAFAAGQAARAAFCAAAAAPIASALEELARTLEAPLLEQPSEAETERFAGALRLAGLCAPTLGLPPARLETIADRLPEASLGWMILDQADRLAPEAAIAPSLIARQLIAVGDGAQLGPVGERGWTLGSARDASAALGLAQEFEIDPERWAAPFRSALDTIARAAPAGWLAPNGERRGLPLPFARPAPAPLAGAALELGGGAPWRIEAAADGGEDAVRWIDAPANAAPWSAEIEDRLFDVLERLANEGALEAKAPPIEPFVIATPFPAAAVALRRRLIRELDAASLFDLDPRANGLEAAMARRVASLEALRGQRARTALLALGGGSLAERIRIAEDGAFAYAALALAEERLVVIAPRTLWRDRPGFDALARAAKIETHAIAAAEG